MNRNAIISLIVLVAGILACATPSGIAPTPVVITQVIVVPNEQQAQASPTLPLPTIPSVTFAPTPTETAILSTATVASTATSSGAVATFIKDTNCRQGPGTQYDVETSFFNGETVQIVGRNPDFDNTWWYVVIPATGGKCWVSLTTAQASGDFDAIPTVAP